MIISTKTSLISTFSHPLTVVYENEGNAPHRGSTMLWKCGLQSPSKDIALLNQHNLTVLFCFFFFFYNLVDNNNRMEAYLIGIHSFEWKVYLQTWVNSIVPFGYCVWYLTLWTVEGVLNARTQVKVLLPQIKILPSQSLPLIEKWF